MSRYTCRRRGVRQVKVSAWECRNKSSAVCCTDRRGGAGITSGCLTKIRYERERIHLRQKQFCNCGGTERTREVTTELYVRDRSQSTTNHVREKAAVHCVVGVTATTSYGSIVNEGNVVFIIHKWDHEFAKRFIEIIFACQWRNSNGTSATCLLEIARRKARLLFTVLIPKVKTNWACPKVKKRTTDVGVKHCLLLLTNCDKIFDHVIPRSCRCATVTKHIKRYAIWICDWRSTRSRKTSQSGTDETRGVDCTHNLTGCVSRYVYSIDKVLRVEILPEVAAARVSMAAISFKVKSATEYF